MISEKSLDHSAYVDKWISWNPQLINKPMETPQKRKKTKTGLESVVVELLDLTGWSKVNDEETEKDLS